MNQYKRYERGSIIFVDFGKNVGYEFNGKHFAIVLDKFDKKNSGTIEVVPLTSKDGKGRHVKLDKSLIETIISNSFADLMMLGYVSGTIGRKKAAINIFNARYNTELPHIEEDALISNYLSSKNVLLVKHNYEDVLDMINKDIEKSKVVSEYYKKYNKYSYARIESTRQIDKSRIMAKVNDIDPVGDITIPEKYLSRINKAFLNKYVD